MLRYPRWLLPGPEQRGARTHQPHAVGLHPLLVWGSDRHAELVGDGKDVFVPSPREIHEDHLILGHCRRQARSASDRMRGFERGDDPLGAAQQLEGVECFTVGRNLEPARPWSCRKACSGQTDA